jgi:hypothetical protein
MKTIRAAHPVLCKCSATDRPDMSPREISKRIMSGLKVGVSLRTAVPVDKVPTIEKSK